MCLLRILVIVPLWGAKANRNWQSGDIFNGPRFSLSVKLQGEGYALSLIWSLGYTVKKNNNNKIT